MTHHTQERTDKMDGVSMEMPKYRSHKTVWALQISEGLEILPDGSAKLTFTDARYSPRIVAKEVVSRYIPIPGDYFVVYGDGYQSISPKAAFEDGYTLI
jgi:hypothetical protein